MKLRVPLFVSALTAPPSERRAISSTSWGESRPCTESLATYSAIHSCGILGPHYAHVCADPDCGFRWAK